MSNPSEIDILTSTLEMTAAMVQEANTAKLLQTGLELCVRMFECERGRIISQVASDMYSVVEHVGVGTKSDPFSTTALKLALESEEPLLISDTIGDQVLSMTESITQHDIRSILCACLQKQKQQQNAVFLYLDSRTDRYPFNQQDLQRFKILCQLMTGLVSKVNLISSQEATIEELRERVEDKQFENFVFSSQSFAQCLNTLKQVAPTDVPVLIMGETGTGKEMLAHTVHTMSSRKDKPYLTVNCGAIPSNLIESQLFGHEKGAFTGALSAKKGYFEDADGGTLFLDEIGELPLDIQAHFLRVLQEGEIVRVGATRSISVDVRIVAATNVLLEQAVSEGKFRQDLFYRLNVVPISVPPVRERAEDSLQLARFFLNKYTRAFGKDTVAFSRDAEKAIVAYDWPGNVREIQNTIQRAVITCAENKITAQLLGLDNDTISPYKTLREARDAVDKEMVEYALSRSPDNLTNAAKILDIDRKSLRLLIEKHGLK